MTDRTALTDEAVARMFHDAYERLAPTFGYQTRRESAVPWEQVPEQNRGLMVAVVHEVRAALTADRAAEPVGRIVRAKPRPVSERDLDFILTAQPPAEPTDLGPHPNCSRCRGTGECDNAQFRCPCRWSTSPIRADAERRAAEAAPPERKLKAVTARCGVCGAYCDDIEFEYEDEQ